MSNAIPPASGKIIIGTVPIVEAMATLVLTDHLLRQRAAASQ